jgi:5-methylcytosine-specific restriction endonuclease McrA
MQGQRAQDLDKMRKLNYYYSHFSKKYNLYKADAYKVTLEDIKKLYSAKQCFYCSRELTEEEKTVDHKLPVSKGGTNEITNLVICCQTCNSKKSNQTAEEYRSAS